MNTKLIALAAVAAWACNLSATTYEVTTVAELTTALSNAADTGDEIHLAAGVYDLTAELVVNKGVRIYGDSFETTVLRRPSTTTSNYRVISLDHATAKLDHVTVTGGKLANGWDVGGGGIKIGANGGTVSYCMISNNVLAVGNSAGAGVGMKNGRLEHSFVIQNSIDSTADTASGGGVGFFSNSGCTATPIVDTCLIAENSAPNNGGGGVSAYLFYATGNMGDITIRNCTIANNSAKKGGGVYEQGLANRLYLKNCIIAGNSHTAPVGSYGPNIDAYIAGFEKNLAGRCSNCLIGNDGTQKDIGGTNTLGDPAFKSVAEHDYHLKDSSAALKKCTWYSGVLADLDGVARAENTYDCGCYEYVEDKTFLLEAVSNCEKAFIDEYVILTAVPYNPPDGVVYLWTLKSEGAEDLHYTGEAVTNKLPVGVWSATLDARVGDVSKKTAAVAKPITVGVRKMYVTCQPNENAEAPYDTVATAATNLIEALACSAAIDGTTIDLDEGTHITTAEPIVTKGVKIVGRGIDATAIKSGALAGTSKVVYTRVLQLNHCDAVVSNLTLRGQLTNGGWEHGSVLYIGVNGGTAVRCRITGGKFNVGNGYGAGAAMESLGAKLIDCEIDACSNLWSKAAALYCKKGLVRGCLIHDCYSAGQSQANVAATMGDIVSLHGDVTLESCTIVSNKTIGSSFGAVAVFANSLPTRVVNNIVALNAAPNNTPADSANNGAPNWATNTDLSKNTGVNCWQGSKVWGATGIAADPAFLDVEAGDYRFTTQSPCAGKGVVYDWMSGALDLDGQSRLRRGKVDLGCYQAVLSGTTFMVK